MIRLADDLHITVLDAVVHHLDEVSSAGLTDPIATRFSVRFRGYRLKRSAIKSWVFSIKCRQ